MCLRVISSNLSYRIQGTLKSQIIATVCSMVEALCSPPSCALGVRLGNVFHFMVDWPRGMDEQQHSKSWTKTQADLPYHHRIHVHPNVPPRTHTIATCVAFVFKSRLAGQHNSTQYSLAICSEKEKPVMLRKYMLVRFDCMYIYRWWWSLLLGIQSRSATRQDVWIVCGLLLLLLSVLCSWSNLRAMIIFKSSRTRQQRMTKCAIIVASNQRSMIFDGYLPPRHWRSPSQGGVLPWLSVIAYFCDWR